MTLEEALAEGGLRCAESETPKLDAQLLLCHCLGVDRTYLLTWPDSVLPIAQLTLYRELLSQREKGVPIAHILGYRDFWTFRLKVNASTLIPRPDTEVLVETCLDFPLAENSRVLDLGTGTGAIALALALERPHWQVDAVDVEAEAVALAQFNQQALGCTNLRVLQSNWFSSVQHQYQLIVSNPPYIDEQDQHLQTGDVRFEPSSALVAGQQGLADIYNIIEAASAYLINGGWLAFEHGYDQGEAVRTFFASCGYVNVATKRDYGGQERVTYAQKYNSHILL
ncbi:peptide chain release factor N(5)-glutamine methyltransferase [Aliidiomarina taiwanensis]|uniref:Release factor glutamine methyltransferase n=1 Tax=Aliidiomarina taiwanensis TaxID=946228 RepID=A0A432X9A9_9GAMM|nr:peptide chain release factor N(5)-glutamine methyltransferase [Aliidiomarina taiwanensis]RUO43904.1 peptide chain release factor N(5)-glutamine methyltransferase [Aliidiomarina taiwanensis]